MYRADHQPRQGTACYNQFCDHVSTGDEPACPVCGYLIRFMAEMQRPSPLVRSLLGAIRRSQEE